MTTLQTIQTILEDADYLGFIRAGSFRGEYDKAALYIDNLISSDMSIIQINKVVWDAFYLEFCCCKTIDNEYIILDKKQGRYILGDEDKFTGIARNIRWMLYKQ